MRRPEPLHGNAIDNKALRARIDDLTKACETAVGNMDLNLLSAMFNDRRRLLDRISAGTDASEAADLLRTLCERDAIVRSRLKAMRDDIAIRLARMNAEPVVRRRYAMSALNSR